MGLKPRSFAAEQMHFSVESLRTLLARLIGSEIGRETIGSLGLKAANTGLAFLGTVVLARVLEPAGYGVYAYVYALVTLLAVPSQFGMPTLVLRETARGTAQGDYGAVQGIWRWAGRSTTLISLGLVGAAALAAWALRASLAHDQLAAFAWGLILVPLVALGNLRGAALRGLNRVVAGQLPELLLRPGLLVLLVAGAGIAAGGVLSAADAMALHAAAAALAFAAGAWMLWKATPAPIRAARPRSESRSWWISSLPLAFSSGMAILNRHASVLILGLFVPAADVGIYRVAAQASLLAAFGLDAVNMVVAPRFATLFARGEAERLQRLVTASARLILALSLVMTVGFVVFGKPFLRLVFGAPYEAAYIPMVILLAGQLVNSATGSVGALLNMTRNERETAKGMAVAAASNVALNFALIPVWGTAGAALATAASLMIWNVLMWRSVRKRLGVNSLAFHVGKAPVAPTVNSDSV